MFKLCSFLIGIVIFFEIIIVHQTVSKRRNTTMYKYIKEEQIEIKKKP